MNQEHPGIPVLEIGGTHVTAALVDTRSWRIRPGSDSRRTIRARGTAEELLADIADAAASLSVAYAAEWAVAIPGPFDYRRGIGLFEHVAKFDSLRGVDMRESLSRRIHPTPRFIHFLNDAEAYAVGEYAAGAGRGYERLACITLGTGVGSGFLVDGEPVSTGSTVPPDGSVHLLEFRGKPLEQTVSRRAIRAAFAAASGTTVDAGPDVHEIASLARSGDRRAGAVLGAAFRDLGSALAHTITAFGAQAVVIGGSMSESWDLVEPAVRAGLVTADSSLATLPLLPAEHPHDAPVVGAAFWAARHHA